MIIDNRQNKDKRAKNTKIIVIAAVIVIASMFIPIPREIPERSGADEFRSVEIRNAINGDGKYFSMIKMSDSVSSRHIFTTLDEAVDYSFDDEKPLELIIRNNRTIITPHGENIGLALSDSSYHQFASRTYNTCFAWGMLCKDSSNVMNLNTDRTVKLASDATVKIFGNGCDAGDLTRNRETKEHLTYCGNDSSYEEMSGAEYFVDNFSDIFSTKRI